jgi:hypothetical protein
MYMEGKYIVVCVCMWNLRDTNTKQEAEEDSARQTVRS